MSKINILVCPSDRYGVGHFRSIDPHIELAKSHTDDFKVDFNFQPDWNNEEYLKQFNIIHVHSSVLVGMENSVSLIEKLKSSNIKVVLDIDDYWDLGKKHPYGILARAEKMGEKIIENLKVADYVTTTTEYFANEIKKINKNVFVIPNAIDSTSKKYTIKDVESKRVRIGWLGGSAHLADIELLKPMFDSINQKYADEVQTVLCGFDSRGVITEVHPETGERKNREIKIEETSYYKYEKIMTNDFKHISDKAYVNFLAKYKNEEYPNAADMPYRRVWTKPFSTYTTNYNLMDITLAPLIDTDGKFNLCKSELKVIESGFFKKPIIASDAAPYNKIIKHGVNGFLVKPNSKKDWAYYAKQLIADKELREKMGQALYDSVKDKYELSNVTKERANIYKQILK